MILDDLQDHSDYVEAEFQAQLIRDYGKTFKIGPFTEETLAMILEHHEEWYEMGLAAYRREVLDKQEYIQGPYGELFTTEDYREAVGG